MSAVLAASPKNDEGYVSETFPDSAISDNMFKWKLSALMKFIHRRQILREMSTFISRIEY
jgi:hypothetical protein